MITGWWGKKKFFFKFSMHCRPILLSNIRKLRLWQCQIAMKFQNASSQFLFSSHHRLTAIYWPHFEQHWPGKYVYCIYMYVCMYICLFHFYVYLYFYFISLLFIYLYKRLGKTRPSRSQIKTSTGCLWRLIFCSLI